MAHVTRYPVVDEGRRLPASQFVVAHEEVNCDAALCVLDEFAAALALRRCGVLTLPVESVLVDPVVEITVILRLALLVERHQQHVGVVLLEHNMAAIPDARIEAFAE